jgi:hypothetical protein
VQNSAILDLSVSRGISYQRLRIAPSCRLSGGRSRAAQMHATLPVLFWNSFHNRLQQESRFHARIAQNPLHS